MKNWQRGGKAAAQVVMEMIMRVRAPCVAAYTVIEAMVHRMASSKHVKPIQFLRDQEKQKRMTSTVNSQ